MLYMMITPPLVPDGWTHVSTDYQIAEDNLFQNIVIESLNDEDNKIIKIFTKDLDPDKVYYGRARVIFDKSIGEWTPIEIIRPRDIDELNLSVDVPSIIGVPKVNVNMDVNNLYNSHFTITTSDFVSNNSSKHLFTNYSIRDLNNKTVYSNLQDYDNLTSLFIDEIALKDGHTYIIDVSYGSTSNDISDIGSLIVKVPNIPLIKVKSKIYGLTKEKDLLFEIEPNDDIVTIRYDIYPNELTIKEKSIYSITPNTTSVLFSKDIFSGEDESFIVLVTITDKGGNTFKKYIPLIFNKEG